MDNRIDHLFKKRLGGATSSDVPANKAATLDALTKSRGGFRLWMLLPLLLLIGGTGWAVYHFQFSTNTNDRVAVSAHDTQSSAAMQEVQQKHSTTSTAASALEPNLDGSTVSSKTTVKQEPEKRATPSDFAKNNKTSGYSAAQGHQSTTTSGEIDLPTETQTGDEASNNDFTNKTVILDGIPNDHSVSVMDLRNGVFDWRVLPNGGFTPLKAPTPIWTITARGLVGGAIPVFGNTSSEGGTLREKHESSGLTYGAELGIERTFGKWRVGSGIGAMRIQSTVEYPVLSEMGEVTIDSTIWTTFLNTYYEVDSTFNPVFGIWDYDTTYFTELDSIGVDTSWIELAQIANGSLQKANGRSSISLITIPLQLQYKLFENDRIGSLHALGGVQWVYAYRRRGYFVTTDGEGLVALSEDPGFKQMNLHLNVGLDWRYPLTDRLFTTVQPILNYSILDWQSGYDQRFVTPMLKFGLGWRLK